RKMEIMDPGTGQAFATVPFGGQIEIDSAVEAARNAFERGEWRDMPPNKRAEIICELCDAIDSQTSRMAMYDSMSNGAPISWVAGGIWVVNNTMRNLAWYGTNKFPWEEDIPGTAGSVYGLGAHKIRREPIGVCAAICPWNTPYMQVIGKMAHSLVTGNTIVIKPASATPFSALILAELIAESPIPDGVVNVITGPGSEIGEKLCTHPDVDKVSLTGSVEVGKKIMSLAGGDLKRVTLELGGKSANIVLDDADLEVAVDGAIAANFQNAGQVCISGSRLLLNKKIYEPFLKRLEQRIKEIEKGMGYQLLPETRMGPVSSARQLETVERYVQIGKDEGARLVCGGKRPDGEQFKDGFYYLPTIFADVDNKMRIAQEEIFGPVLSVIPFDDDDDAISIANDTNFGLAGAVWSKDIKRARNIADKVRTGTMWINDVMILSDFAPFGGFKDSGIGKEMGHEGLAGYTQSKMIYISNEGTANRGTFGSVLNY
ncbi:MAG: aldehyde dehydrogenase, partial [bacterium]|nr:aldehyde dehydrogenase [bacterium]